MNNPIEPDKPTEWPCQQLHGGRGAGIYDNVDGLCTHEACNPENADKLDDMRETFEKSYCDSDISEPERCLIRCNDYPEDYAMDCVTAEWYAFKGAWQHQQGKIDEAVKSNEIIARSNVEFVDEIAAKDKQIAKLRESVDVWMDNCKARDKQIEELKAKNKFQLLNFKHAMKLRGEAFDENTELKQRVEDLEGWLVLIRAHYMLAPGKGGHNNKDEVMYNLATEALTNKEETP